MHRRHLIALAALGATAATMPAWAQSNEIRIAHVYRRPARWRPTASRRRPV